MGNRADGEKAVHPELKLHVEALPAGTRIPVVYVVATANILALVSIVLYCNQ
jgi:hypothetical protein